MGPVSVAVYNTLTRRKEELVPREPGKISMYVCGPTVYNHIHIGNARAFIVFDVIRRYLAWRGFDVLFVENYTDVDDKIIAKAAEEGIDPEEVAAHYAGAFEQLMKTLDVSPPDILVRATDHIADMIDMVGTLIDRGYAYESGGNVWFAVEKFPSYGKLSGRTLGDMRAGERVEPDPSKRFPLDFALWKAAKPGEPSWAGPWGAGRPGWHIECSAMSLRYLGMGFDIHGGGSDLIFPHHENEIAQSEAARGEEPFVRYWLHNGMVTIDEEKMSKSLGNFVLLRDLLEAVPAPVVRLLAVTGHYRSDVDWGPDQIEDARRSYERLDIFRRGAGEPSAEASDEGREFIERFRAAMDDDFNTPEALGVLHDLLRRGNILLDEASRGSRVRLDGLAGPFDEMTQVLGIGTRDAGLGRAGPPVEDLVELLVAVRDEARRAARYGEADSIRARLAELGVVLEDTAGETRWRLKM